MSDSDRGTPGAGFWALLLTILAAFTVPGAFKGYRAPAAPQSTSSASESISASPRNASANDTPAPGVPAVDYPIYEYLGEELPKAPAPAQPAVQITLPLITIDSRPKASSYDPTPVRRELAKRGDVLGLIATIPPPTGSTVSHLFDSRVEAVQAAVATAGYSLVRFYIPRLPDGQTAKSDTNSEPGLLLFRRKTDTDAKSTTLLVYLVWESPISGVDERAFKVAVDRLSFWDESSDPLSGSQFTVIGPSFSGSSVSLAHAIAESRGCWYYVITGGATAIDHEMFYKLSGNKAYLASTRMSTTSLREAAIEYLANHRIKSKRPLKIAWLVEAGTAFGASDMLDEHKAGRGELPVEITEFSFPFHLRLMSSQLSRVRTSSSPQLAIPNQSLLEFGIPDAAKARDIPPLFTPGQSAPATEQDLRHTLSTIRHGEYDAVGISATDNWDYVALCELIAEVCPDKQVILTGASRLFVHQQHLRFMRGCLVASTYVPDLQTPTWSFPWGKASEKGHSTRTFRYSADSEGQIGFYNALVLALNNPRIHFNDGKYQCHVDVTEDSLPSLVSYGIPFQTSTWECPSACSHQPGAYVSVIGATGFIPLTYKSAKPDNETGGNKRVSQIPLVTVNSVRKASDGNNPLYWVQYPAPSRVFLPVLLMFSLAGVAAFGRTNNGFHQGSTKTHQGNLARVRTMMDRVLLLISPLPVMQVDATRTDAKAIAGLPARQAFAASFFALFSLGIMVWLSFVTMIPIIVRANHPGGPWVLLTAAVVVVVTTAALGLLTLPDTFPAQRCVAFITRVMRTCGIPIKNKVVSFVLVFLLPVLAAIWHGFGVADPVGGHVYTFALVLANAVLWFLIWINRWRRSKGAFHGLKSPHGKPVHPRLCTLISTAQGVTLFLVLILGLFSITDVRGWWNETLDTQAVITEMSLWFTRSLDVTGGGSLLLTMILLTHVIFAWAFALFRRLNLRSRSQPAPPWGFDTTLPDSSKPLARSAHGLVETTLAIDGILTHGCAPLKKQSPVLFCVVFSGLLLWLSHLANRTPCTFSTRSMTIYIWFVAALALVFWTHTMLQLIMLRIRLHKMLKQVAWLPLVNVLPRIPEQVRTLVGRFMDARLLRPSHLRVRLHYLSKLSASLLSKTMIPYVWHRITPDADDISRMEKSFADELKLSPEWELVAPTSPDELATPPMHVTYANLNSYGQKLWKQLLDEWSNRSPLEAYPNQLGVTDTGDSKAPDTDAAIWIRTAEEFVAIQFVGYWHSILTYFYGLIWSAMAMTLLLVLAVLAYPMHPQRLLLGTAFTMLAAITGFAVNSLFVIEGNRVHTLLRGKTTAGVGLDPTIIVKLVTWLLPGTLILLSYIFPGAVDSVLSLLKPFVMSPK